MDIITAIEPSLEVSLLFGLASFDKKLRRSFKIRLFCWSFFFCNIILQYPDSYYYLKLDLAGISNMKTLILKYPHDSSIITFNCFFTSFIILTQDRKVSNALIRLREFNRTLFPIKQQSLSRFRRACRIVSSGSVLFCAIFVGSNGFWWWFMQGTENLRDYVFYCIGIFVRYGTHSVLSNQLATYYSIIWLWYGAINDRLRKIEVRRIRKESKGSLRLLAKADTLIKDFNRDIAFVYSPFILLSCAVILAEGIHVPVHFVFSSELKIYEIAVTLSFFSGVVIQVFLFIIASSLASEKARKTAHYVNNLIIYCDNMDMKEEIEIFSLQLLHQNVEFTACGFFKLDFALICGLVGTATTYILIIIQLHTPKFFNARILRNQTT